MTFLARTSPLAIFALLAACGGVEPAPDIAEQGGEQIACALDGADAFAEECRLIEANGKWRVVHPDGGFRLLEKADGGFVTADGAAQAEATRDGGMIVLAIENDRYRLPE